ncbi:hypothetical protein MPTA5024_14865, partial [Microbispora sp. ATCC PTA-5024]
MNEIINRLRDATRAVGETVDEVPPFEPEARPSTRTSRASRPWLVPIAAAAAVTVAVAGGAAVARHGGGAMNVAAGTTAGPPSAPSYFAEAGPDGVTIKSVRDGKVTGTVDPPADGESYSAIQAAQDNRLFYVASRTADCRPRIFQLRIADDGTVGSWGVLPYGPPEGRRITSLAVDGDGSTIAYTTVPCRGTPGTGDLVVTDTGTGDSRTWTSSSRGAADLSMSADGRYVLFRPVPLPPVLSPEASAVPSGAPVAPKVEPSLPPEEIVTPPATPGVARTPADRVTATAAPSSQPSVERVPPITVTAVPSLGATLEPVATATVTLSAVPSPAAAGAGRAAPAAPT